MDNAHGNYFHRVETASSRFQTKRHDAASTSDLHLNGASGYNGIATSVMKLSKKNYR